MRFGAADVVRGQRLVEADRGIYLLHNFGGRRREAATPHLVGGFVVHEFGAPVGGLLQQGSSASQPREGEMSKTRSVSTASYVSVALLSALAGFAAIYVTLGRSDNVGGETARVLPQGLPAQHAQDQPAGLPAGPGVNPLSTGQMAAFVFKKAPEPLPDVLFLDGAGVARSVNDWRGKVVLLNLWATWCAPCRKEMPALDRLQAALGSDKFEVVALSVDRTGLEGAK